VQGAQFGAEFGEGAEVFFVARVGDAGEVDFQEFPEFFAVGRAVEGGVDIVENVQRGEGVGVLGVFGREAQTDSVGDGFYDVGVEGGFARSFAADAFLWFMGL